jgi:hypothetical protein
MSVSGLKYFENFAILAWQYTVVQYFMLLKIVSKTQIFADSYFRYQGTLQ